MYLELGLLTIEFEELVISKEDFAIGTWK